MAQKRKTAAAVSVACAPRQATTARVAWVSTLVATTVIKIVTWQHRERRNDIVDFSSFPNKQWYIFVSFFFPFFLSSCFCSTFASMESIYGITLVPLWRTAIVIGFNMWQRGGKFHVWETGNRDEIPTVDKSSVEFVRLAWNRTLSGSMTLLSLFILRYFCRYGIREISIVFFYFGKFLKNSRGREV